MKNAAAAEPAVLCYVETSGLLAAVLEDDVTAERALRDSSRLVTSALTLVEGRRAILRAQQSGRLTVAKARYVTQTLEAFAKRCALVGVTDEVLHRAGRAFLVEPVRTLDAIHLATMEILGEPPALITVLTRDDRVRNNALAGGYGVA